ncbi:MAG: LamG domain-containing protein [Bacteroidota bacterium]
MMKTLFTLLFLLVTFASNAQRTMFGGHNNYVGPVAPPSLVTTGLVLNLDAGNAASYPGTGTTWTDLGGSNHGTLTNGPIYNAGNGGSIVFDGIDDVISFGNILNMGLNSWTISCWVKFDGGSGLMGIIGKTSYRSYEGRYSIYIDNNNLLAFFQPGASSMIVSTPLSPFLDNKFHNIVLTINRTSIIYLYVDGISVGTPIDVSSTSSLNPNSSDHFYIGSYASSDGQNPLYFFKGSIGQALIYNRALIASEVTNNFNLLKSRFGL